MHENKFEKQVQEKMDELGFTPPEAIWTHVDHEINKKNRRRIPLFWIFFLSGIMVAGGMYMFNTSNKNSQTAVAATNLPAEQSKNNRDAVMTPNPDSVTKEQPELKHARKYKDKILNPYTEADIESKIIFPENDRDFQIKTTEPDFTRDRQNISVAANEFLSVKPEENITISTVLKKSAISDSANNEKETPDKKQENKNRKWNFGVSAGAGVSSLKDGIFQSSGNLYAANNYSGAPSSPPVLGNANSVMSPVNSAGFAWNAGLTASRNLSKLVSLSIGLDYQYLSSTIKTGEKQTGPIYLNGVAQTQLDRNYYSAGQNVHHNNNYQFVGIPLAVQFKINKSGKPGLYWELNISPSYMISSNALHYNSQLNVYYENNSDDNKFQLNAGTSILVGFHINNTEWKVGPQIQYGITSLMKSSENSDHILYGGLRVMVYPFK